MIVVEGASILGERIEQSAKRGPRLSVEGVRVRSSYHVRAGGVNAGVNGKRGEIDLRVAFHNLAGMIHENQVGDTNSTEVQAERVHPETIGPLGIARGDVAGDAFVEAELGKEAKGSGEAFLAMTALFGG